MKQTGNKILKFWFTAACVTFLSISSLHAQYAGGPSDVCRDTPASYSASSEDGCQFSGWAWSGVAEIVEGDRTSERIVLKWSSNGEIWGNFSCAGGNQPIQVTLHEKPTIVITPSAYEVTEGNSVTLTASGGSTYSWSGPNVSIGETRNPITVVPPAAGTNLYYVNGTDSYYCSNSVNITINVIRPAVDAGPDRSYCKETHTIDLAGWGLNMASGSWSGSGVNGGFINLDQLSRGTYTITYTRTVDGSSDYMTLTVLNSVGGNVDVTESAACLYTQGTLTIKDNQGDVDHWERSDNDGVSYSPIGNSSGGTYSFNEDHKTFFRAAVKDGDCAITYSSPVSVRPLKPIGGNLAVTSVNHLNCDRAYGGLAVQNYWGNKLTWQKYTNAATGWEPITGVSTDTYAFDVSEQTSFRVMIENTATSCDAAYSSIYTAYVTSQGGTVRTGRTQFCEDASGFLNLSGHLGNVVEWEYSIDNVTWSGIAATANRSSYSFNTSAPVNYYRAEVKLDNCESAFSNAIKIEAGVGEKAGYVVVADGDQSPKVIPNVTPMTFRVTFKLQDALGTVRNWRAETEQGATQIDNTTSSWTTDIQVTTAASAFVKVGTCDPLYSGRAIFIVNKPFIGILRVINLIIGEYDGHSFTYGEGLSLQEPFRFESNDGQDFFVLLDKDYSVPPPDENYVLEETILQPGLKTDEDVLFANARQRSDSYTYVDGLGRPLQQIQRRASPLEKDVIKHQTYDKMGRPDKDFLPYTATTDDGAYKATVASDQHTFYQNPLPEIAMSDYPFSVMVYEDSPRRRLIEQGFPGADWQPVIGHTRQFQEQINNLNEIKRWEVNVSDKPVSLRNYFQGDLAINTIIDEHGSSVKEYTDKEGLVVLKEVQNGEDFLRTIYIYDDFKLLRYVIQPEGVEQLADNPDDDFLNAWSFQYRYDDRHRVIEKYVPGGGWTHLVYDKGDRLILSQDPNQRLTNLWGFTKYDALNRTIMTGLFDATDSSDPSRTVTRSELTNQLDSNPILTEVYNGNASNFGYSNNAFPIQNTTIMTVNYYDNYRVVTDLFSSAFSYDYTELAGLDQTPFPWIRGQLTATQVRIIGTNTFLKSVTWYNKLYQPIQTLREDFGGVAERTSTLFDFVGKITAQSVRHIRSAKTTIVVTEFEYDHGGRPLAQYMRVNGGARVLQNKMVYNELGQLVEKNLHEKEAGFTQSLDYRYNIRGWLTHINNAALVNDAGVTNDEANDFFGFELSYNNISAESGPAQFNGNINRSSWKSLGSNKQAYAYTYDPANRIQQAAYFDLDNPTNIQRFSEKIIEYDKNGNIRRLQRYGLMDEPTVDNLSPYGLMDDLKYTYSGNRLTEVKDEVTATTDHEGGFKDGNKTGLDYEYDPNGNMTLDRNKSVTSITYNHLHLPETVTNTSGETVSYTYDASGRKVSQVATQSGQAKHTEYIGQFIYEEGDLQFILSSDGRVVMNGAQPEYQYFIKDHLGNVRVTFTSNEETEVNTATLESDQVLVEQSHFLYYEEAVKVNSSIFDHTNTGPTKYSTRLRGSENERYGLAKSISVMPGDTIRAEVFAKYLDTDQSHWEQALIDLITSIANNTSPAGTIIDGGSPGSIGSQLFPYEGFLNKGDETGTAPKAYLNWMVFDRNYNFINGGFVPVTEDAREDGKEILDHQKLEKEIIIGSPGFVYLYLSNDNVALGGSEVEVYFDDFKVEHVKSLVVDETSYYAYGLAFNAHTRENSVLNNYKYNGKEEQTALGLGWLDYGARMYMPELGRFFETDRFAEKYASLNSYHYGANNPISFVDINGDSLWIAFGEKNKNRVLYHNGKLLNADGSRYEGEGVKVTAKGKIRITDSFLASAVNGLSAIGKGETKMGTNVIGSLQDSKYNYTIAKGVDHFDPGTFDKPYLFANQASYNMTKETGLTIQPFWNSTAYDLLPADQVGSGGVIYWNGNTVNKAIELGHEMFHAFDATTGDLIIDPTRDPRSTIDNTNIGEIRAATFENGLRKFNGYPLREEYNEKGHKLIDKKGNPIVMPPAKVIKK